MPQNKKNRKEKLEQIQKQEQTTILYEAPHKIIQTLEDLKQILGQRKVVIARELTKIHEEYITGTIEELQKEITSPKGEYVIIIEKSKKKEKEIELEKLNNLTLEQQYEYYKKQGMNKKDIIKQIAKDRNVSKNEIYQKFLKA